MSGARAGSFLPEWIQIQNRSLQARGLTVIRHFDVEFAKCDCVTHEFVGIDCVSVIQRSVGFRPQFECTQCQTTWRSET